MVKNVCGVEVSEGINISTKEMVLYTIIALLVILVFIRKTEKNITTNNYTTNITNNIGDADNTHFMKVLAKRESNNKWRRIGGYNDAYIGLYQFGDVALKDINSDVRVKAFKKDNSIFTIDKQNKACIALMKNNKRYLSNHYKYIGKTIRGTKVTESGMLAAAHLVGHTAVKKWLESNGKVETKDGFDTSLVEYMNLMNKNNVKVNI
jgi:hypothetical protein